MGQAIVYCSRCNAQLREADFQKGSAVKAEHKTYCLKCLPEGVVPNSPEKSSDSNPIRKRSGTSLSMAPAPQKEPPRPVLIWALGLAMGVIVLILALFLFSGPSSRPSPAP